MSVTSVAPSSTASPLDASVQTLHGVGPRITERLARLGIHSVYGLLFHLPARYQDRTRVQALASLQTGTEVLIEATIHKCQLQYGRRRALLCRVRDGTGEIALRFFHFSQDFMQHLAVGRTIRCFGEVRRGPRMREMVHPEVQFVGINASPRSDLTLTPVYPTTEGLHQLSLRKLINQALTLLDDSPTSLGDVDRHLQLLEDKPLRLPPLHHAIRYLHTPPADADIDALLARTHSAQQRLALQELLAHQLSQRRLRAQAKTHDAYPIKGACTLRDQVAAAFGFELTPAQQRVVKEIDADLNAPTPMLRLLQGDVGAGKTAVAACLAASVVDTGLQVAFMAPTELLAEQHIRTLSKWFAPHGIALEFLSGKLSRSARRDVLARVAGGPAAIIVGTHALFQDDVAFNRLGLVIVDEQHRFGVDQRLALLEKGAAGKVRPHQLIMTATPIPRTLAMTTFADLDVSIIDELPPGRMPIRTVVVPQTRRSEISARIEDVCARGRQVYWVCPLIEESAHLASEAATETADALVQTLPTLRIGLVHGRLVERDKNRLMEQFLAGKIDVLVATTVIEVGVDVPNASLMIIENAERLGLSQLHQLRGRVGRGTTQADCVLLYKPPLSDTARLRLHVMRESNDGFFIAEQDLQLRGPGELLGTKQTGARHYRIADMVRDHALIPTVRRVADQMLATDPNAAEDVIRHWLEQRVEYAKV